MSDQQNPQTIRPQTQSTDWGQVLFELTCLVVFAITLGFAYLTAIPIARSGVERWVATGVLFVAYGMCLLLLYWVFAKYNAEHGDDDVRTAVQLLAVPLGAFVGLAMLKLSYLVLFVW